MADELSPSEIENVRNDFVNIDRRNNGYIVVEEYVEYYLTQSADVSDNEMRIFCSGILSSKHWTALELKHANITDTNAKRLKKAQMEKEILEQVMAEERLQKAIEAKQSSKDSLERIKKIAEGSGSMVDWTLVDTEAQEKAAGLGTGGGLFKSKMMVLGHFAKRHQEQRSTKKW